MSTPSTDTAPTVPTCLLCEKALAHAEVVMVGFDLKGEDIRVHPQCLGTEKDKLIKALVRVDVIIEPGRAISPAKQIVVRKRAKEIFKALRIADEMKRQAAK